MSRLRLIVIILLLVPPMGQADTAVENIRLWEENDKTRIVLDLSRPAEHNIFTLNRPDRLVVDLKDGRLSGALVKLPSGTGVVKSIRTGMRANGQLRIVLDLYEVIRSRSFTEGPNQQYGNRLVIDLQRQDSLQVVKSTSETYVHGRDIVIAVDPGHGGYDPGAIGRAKTKEKDVALAVARLLANRIDDEPGMKAILVRKGDYYVDHRERMETARRNKADLFVSIHADAISDRRVKGASVYVLSLKGASDEAAKRLAQRENASGFVGGVSLADKDLILASVLLDLSSKWALSASFDVGEKVIKQLAGIGTVHRWEVQQAGLLVLKSPDVPSILVETNFISNPGEEDKLKDRLHQKKIASAILIGIRSYFYQNPPQDTQIAMNLKRKAIKQISHVISRGDTLSELATRYNVSMLSIRNTNKLSSDHIRIGQTLRIPVFAGM
jgi:N-acetylmuramoyl-L-alanine amidase